jgi:hypothetical protein
LLREVTFADDNGRFVTVAEVFGALWAVFLCWELRAQDFCNAVACASMPPCHCVTNTMSLWHIHCNIFATGVNFNESINMALDEIGKGGSWEKATFIGAARSPNFGCVCGTKKGFLFF